MFGSLIVEKKQDNKFNLCLSKYNQNLWTDGLLWMKKWSEMFSHQEKAQKQILNNKMRNKNFLR